MIEESGRVVAVDGQAVWVETVQQSACGACAAKATCGNGLAAKFAAGKPNHIRLVTEKEVRVGDRVVLGIPENTLVKSALLAYGLPLLLFVIVAALADSLGGLSEAGVIGVGLAGLLAGFGVVRFIAGGRKGNTAFQPVILEVLPAIEVSIEAASV